MTYQEITPLTSHIDTVISIWYEFNEKHMTEEAVEALKDTIRLTLIDFYGEKNESSKDNRCLFQRSQEITTPKVALDTLHQ